MSHTNPLPERLRASADEVQSFPHPTFCDHLHVAHDVMREAAAALEAYELGARSTAAQPVEPTGLRSAALAMVAKMDVLKPHMDALCLDSHNRGRPYKGPTYGIELEALRAAASGDSTPPSAPVQGDPSGALRPEPEAAGQDRWQPIETAPRDGTTIIVGRDMGDFGFIRGYARFEGAPGSFLSGWVSNGFSEINSNLGLAHPTLWQPLPEPPQAASVERGD